MEIRTMKESEDSVLKPKKERKHEFIQLLTINLHTWRKKIICNFLEVYFIEKSQKKKYKRNQINAYNVVNKRNSWLDKERLRVVLNQNMSKTLLESIFLGQLRQLTS